MRINIALVRILTLLYLAFPLIPFYVGWLKPQYAAVCIVFLLLAFYFYIKNLDFKGGEFVSKRFIFVGAGVLLIWTMFSGAGGFGYQFHDHVKNNTLVKELTNLPWPISYPVEGEEMYLSHYLSYYIIGPSIAGFLGYKYAQLVLFFYVYAGMALGFFWIARALQRFQLRLLGFLILFGGISVFSFLFKYGTDALTEIWHRLETHGYVFWMNSWDVIPLNYLHVTDMLYWTPQHFIPALFGVGLSLNALLVDKETGYLPLLLSVLLMWSPLILVGLFPIFLYVLIKTHFKGMANISNWVIAPLLFLVNASFLLSIEAGELVKNFIFLPEELVGISVLKQVGVYLYFLFFEVLLWGGFIYFSGSRKVDKGLFLLTTLALILIPLYRFGLWNDWCNRVSMPFLVLLGVLVFQAQENTQGLKRVFFIVLFSLASVGPLMDILGSAKNSNFIPKFYPPEETQVKTLPEICVSYPITQFVASGDTFFFKYLAKSTNSE